MSTFHGLRRGRLLLGVALGVLAAIAVAGVASGEKVIVGNIEFEADGGFTPMTLSKTELTPIAFNAEGTIKTLDRSHPPALKEVLLEADKNTAVNVKGYPVCKSGQLQSQDTSHAEAICRDALIGEGRAKASILFVEQKEVPVSSKVLVFNGGENGGVITFYIHAYITIPVPAAIVTTVKIKKVHHGRYGLETISTIPKIAGGAGSITSFSLKIDKKFTYKGKKVSVLSAKCPDGKLQAHAVGTFSDGTKAATDFIRPCTGKS
jgi:hypothetical protein